MLKVVCLFCILIFGFFQLLFSQVVSERDKLFAGIRPERTCFDVTHYLLKVKIDPEEKTIQGSNTISFNITEPCSRIQLDLYEQLQIDAVTFEGTDCIIERKYDAFFVSLPRKLSEGEGAKVIVTYHGALIEAKNPPWDGGFVFTKSENGKPFIGVACEEIGASSWWPTKELFADKCDSADLYFEVPLDLQAISNGQFKGVEKNGAASVYHWKVTFPINNYNISVTIGDFSHFGKKYRSKKVSYNLDYYILPENLKKAKQQFKQVVPMLKSYQRLFGPYPFSRDGYKLVEAPYLGMEHQSAVAYGNGYQNGYSGKFFAPVSQKFDFIIIHETGHEYWGNNVCMSDRSDMWIHEAFCTYSELLYVEDVFGKKYADDYAFYWTQVVRNMEPMVNERFSNQEPSTDIYYKGALLLHTIRNLVADDAKFIACLKAIQEHFALKTVSTKDITDFMINYFNRDLSAIFDQYLYNANPPILNFTLTPNKQGEGYVFRYKWDGTVEKFNLPVTVDVDGAKRTFNVSDDWQETVINKPVVRNLEFDHSKSYYIVKYE